MVICSLITFCPILSAKGFVFSIAVRPEKIVENVPPLDCGEHLCLVPDRDIDRGERPASEEYGWWYAYGPDRDFNGMDDRLQWILHGEESISPTAIIGADGRKTVAIVVDFAWHPTGEDIEV